MSAQPAIGPAAKFQSAAKGVGNGQDLVVGLQDAVVPAIAHGDLGEPAFVVELSNTVITGAVVLPGATHQDCRSHFFEKQRRDANGRGTTARLGDSGLRSTRAA